MKKETKKPQIAIYQTLGDEQKIRVRIEDENVWLTQKLIADLFNIDVRTVNEHLKNIFLDQELDKDSVIRKFRITANDGKTYNTNHYNLDAILAVGYRVRSDRGLQFRQWATERLREYLIKGFTMDDERLKQGGGRARYFQELLQRIRDIRSSERMFYLQRLRLVWKTEKSLSQKILKMVSDLEPQNFTSFERKKKYCQDGFIILLDNLFFEMLPNRK